MKSDKTLLPDLIAALIILTGMFYLMVTTVETVHGADFRPLGIPKCQDMYQTTMKEVLSCD